MYPYTGPPLGTDNRMTWPGTVLGVYTQTCSPSITIASPGGSLNRMASLAGPAWTSVPWLSALSIIGLSITCTKSARRLASER